MRAEYVMWSECEHHIVTAARKMHITLNKKAYSGGNGAREGAEEHSSSGSEELEFHFVRLMFTLISDQNYERQK